MEEMFSRLAVFFQMPFVRYAFIVGILIALCASLLGVTLVLKRFSFIGDGLSHVAFGAMAVAAVVGLTNNMFIVMPITIISAVLLLRTGTNTRIKGDAAVAMISVGALAFGYLLMNKFPTSANVSGDVCTAFIFFYNKIFSVTFDENFARATGTRVSVYNLIIAIIIAVIIVIGMSLVGSLLISALIIFPALSAMRVFKSFKSVTICSACLSVFCAAIGILVSILANTPVGATIVIADIAVFGIFTLIGGFRSGFKS